MGSTMSLNFHFHSIGLFQGPTKNEYDIPRQGIFSEQSGILILNEKQNFEQALQGLQDFSRIWIIYVFHHHSHWKPMVLPPRSEKKVGVFASRSPYRPNAVGICPARLLKIQGRKIFVDQVDLLDGTPILDIKPYIPESDSFPSEKIGWLKSVQTWKIDYTELARCQFLFLEKDLPFLKSFAETQLSTDPLNHKKKRIHYDPMTQTGVLSYRTWRIQFQIKKQGRIRILKLGTGYSPQDLESQLDPYEDKTLHLLYRWAFQDQE